MATIKLKRTTGSTAPTGLSFGEPAWVDGTKSLYIWNNSGTATRIGAEVSTNTSLDDGSGASNNKLATQLAIKTYVDGFAPTSINTTDTTTTNTDYYPVFVAAAGSGQTARIDTSTFTYNPSTNKLTIAGDYSSTATTCAIGQTSTATIALNLGTAVTGSGNIKTIRLGTGGGASSITRIYIGGGDATSDHEVYIGPSSPSEGTSDIRMYATDVFTMQSTTSGISILGSTSTAASLKFLEGTTNGSNFVAIKAPDSLSGDQTYTLPTAYPASNGYVLSSTTGGTLSWASAGSATTVTVTDTDTGTYYPVFVNDVGTASLYADKTTTPMTYVASSSTLTASNFKGNVQSSAADTALTLTGTGSDTNATVTVTGAAAAGGESITLGATTVTATGSLFELPTTYTIKDSATSVNSTLNIMDQSVANTYVKTINIGTNSASGGQSTVNIATGMNASGIAAITIGSSTGTSTTTLNGNVTIGGNLTINGSTTTVNSTVTTLDDPVLVLGGDTVPTSTDSKDRGLELRYGSPGTLTVTQYVVSGGTSVQYTYSGSPSPAPVAGGLITITGAGQTNVNGTWVIGAVAGGIISFTITSAATNGTYTTSLGTVSVCKVGFMGFDVSADEYVFLKENQATTSETYAATSGSYATLNANNIKLNFSSGGPYITFAGNPSANRTLTLPNVTDTVAVLGTAQTFTAAQTFRGANSVRAEAASTQDAIVLAGRGGGTSSYAVTLSPTTLSSNTTLTLPNVTDTVAVLGTAQTFTAAQTFRAANSVRAEAASTQDAIVLAGRAGGTSSYAITLTPATLSSNTTLTLPNVTSTVAVLGTNQTFTGTQTFGNLTSTGVITFDTTTNNQSYTTTSTGTITISSGAAGSINNMNIGATTRGTGAFTTLGANSTVSINTTTNNQSYTTTGAGTITISSGTAGSMDNMNIGATTRGTGAFTTLAANNAVTFTQGTASTSTTTGTLVVTGGIGMSGALWVGSGIQTSSAVVSTVTGTTQGGGTSLSNDINVVTATLSSGTNDAVTLPTATAGKRLVVVNRSSSVALKVFPASGGTIDSLSANAAYTVQPLEYVEFDGTSSTQWYTNNTLDGGTY